MIEVGGKLVGRVGDVLPVTSTMPVNIVDGRIPDWSLRFL